MDRKADLVHISGNMTEQRTDGIKKVYIEIKIEQNYCAVIYYRDIIYQLNIYIYIEIEYLQKAFMKNAKRSVLAFFFRRKAGGGQSWCIG